MTSHRHRCRNICGMFPPNSDLAVCVHVSIWDNFTLLCASRSSLATSTVRVRGGVVAWSVITLLVSAARSSFPYYNQPATFNGRQNQSTTNVRRLSTMAVWRLCDSVKPMINLLVTQALSTSDCMCLMKIPILTHVGTTQCLLNLNSLWQQKYSGLQ